MAETARLDRRTVVAALGAGLLGGCARPPGDLAEERRRPVPEGGIGGTGIVGTVTALGSILVNGLAVAIPNDATISDALGTIPAAAIVPGLSVTVEAAGPAEALAARRIHVDHPLIGTVERRSRNGRRLTVLGTEVRLEPSVQALVDTGDRVAVSGLWRGAEVVASRVVRLAEAGGPSVMAGAVRAARGGGLALGGLVLVLPPGAEPPAAGSYATLTGQRAGGRFVADRLVPGRFTGAAGGLAQLFVEGYLEPVAAAPGYAVSGLGHSFDPAARLGPLAGTRAIFAGPYAGDFAVAAALPLSGDPRARATVLAEPAPLAARPGLLPTR